MLQRTYVHNDFAFVRAAVSTEYIESEPPIYRSYYPDERGLRPALLEAFADFGWSRPFANLERDVDFLLRALLEHFDGELPAPEPDHQLQVLGSAFYRNKAAYVIGKIVNGDAETAFGVPVLHDDGRASSSSTPCCSTTRASRSSSRSRGRTSWSTWTSRPATSTSCRR